MGRLDRLDKNRSALLELAARAYLAQMERDERDQRDVAIINAMSHVVVTEGLTKDDYIAAVEAFVKQIQALPKPAVAAPVADLPSAGEVTAVSFDFAEKVLAQQRATTDKLIAVLTPAV